MQLALWDDRGEADRSGLRALPTLKGREGRGGRNTGRLPGDSAAGLQGCGAAPHPLLSLDPLDAQAERYVQQAHADATQRQVTRSNDREQVGFLRDARRMNVALSRGRQGLVIVGDHVFCRSARNPNPLRVVLEYIDAHPADCSIEEAQQ